MLKILVVILLSLPSVVLAKPPFESFIATGSVIKNHDGDTIKLQTADRGVLTVRLSGADTPETGQAYWRNAKGALGALVKGRQATVSCYKTDRHQRNVCHVSVGTTDAELYLIRQGLAWYAFQFADELTTTQQVAYRQAEQDAHQQRIGLWAEPDPMPPWECRKLRKAHQKCR